MLRFKGCPRCKGDINKNSDTYGSYLECLQCGHMVYLSDRSKRTLRRHGSTDKTAAA
ncbi:MAG: hypothetical protein VX355_02700 [Chloroflexota bacterium]